MRWRGGCFLGETRSDTRLCNSANFPIRWWSPTPNRSWSALVYQSRASGSPSTAELDTTGKIQCALTWKLSNISLLCRRKRNLGRSPSLWGRQEEDSHRADVAARTDGDRGTRRVARLLAVRFLSRSGRAQRLAFVVKGSRVAVSAFATRSLKEATLGNQALAIQKNRFDVPATLVFDSHRLALKWRDDLGLSAKEPFQLRVTALEDEAPNVTSSKLQREQVVLSTDAIKFEVLARDDFGVKTIGIEWKGIEDPLRNPKPSVGEQIVAVGTPEQQEPARNDRFLDRTSGYQTPVTRKCGCSRSTTCPIGSGFIRHVYLPRAESRRARHFG